MKAQNFTAEIFAACCYNECAMQRVYHFVSALHGLDDLRHRHLKIAQLDELNDPFELWAIAQPDPHLQQGIRAAKQELAQKYGLLCFSLDLHNPLLWTHYADRHRGLALGFDVDEKMLTPVSYVETRPILKEVDIRAARSLLFTKYVGWQYEQEARIYTSLKDQDAETGLYFVDFGDQLVLREVIAGPLCTVIERELRDALGTTTEVEVTKARLAFKTFSVANDQRGFPVSE